MIIAIDDASEVPIYRQIRDQIVAGIADGRLAAGEQLPTVRRLAEEIGINSMTVNKAYQLLKQEGYIVTERRNGAKVREGRSGRRGLSAEAERELARIISEARVAGMTEEAFFEVCRKYF